MFSSLFCFKFDINWNFFHKAFSSIPVPTVAWERLQIDRDLLRWVYAALNETRLQWSGCLVVGRVQRWCSRGRRDCSSAARWRRRRRAWNVAVRLEQLQRHCRQDRGQGRGRRQLSADAVTAGHDAGRSPLRSLAHRPRLSGHVPRTLRSAGGRQETAGQQLSHWCCANIRNFESNRIVTSVSQYPSVTLLKELINLLVNITLLIICCAKYVANLYKLRAHWHLLLVS